MGQIFFIRQVFSNRYDIDNIDLSYQNIAMYWYEKKGTSTSLASREESIQMLACSTKLKHDTQLIN